jgi:hypothetical protein
MPQRLPSQEHHYMRQRRISEQGINLIILIPRWREIIVHDTKKAVHESTDVREKFFPAELRCFLKISVRLFYGCYVAEAPVDVYCFLTEVWEPS